MKLPLPLRFTIPATLFLFGLFLGGLSFVYEVTSSYRRIEEDVHRRAEFLGLQTSEMLRYHFLHGDIDAAERQINLLSSSPTLRFAFVCNDSGQILLSNKPEMRDKPLKQIAAAANAREVIEAAQRRIIPGMGMPKKVPPQFSYTRDRGTMSAAFVFAMPPDSDTLQFSGLGTLYLEYDLSTLKQSERADARRRAAIIGAMLGVLCLAIWIFFDRTLTNRVTRLVTATHGLSKGEYSPANLQGSDELAELSKAFDSMAENIRARTAELELANRKMKREIADREQAENRFLSVWKSSVDGMRLTDQHGNIVAVNEAYGRMAGMTVEELQGKPFVICYKPEEAAEMLENYKQRFANRSFQSLLHRQIEFRSGKVADLEVSSSFIAQDNDEPLLLSMFRDVTERKRAEELLQQQAASMKASMDGLAIHDEKGNFIYLNEAHAKIYGYENPQELIGKHWGLLYGPEEMKRFRDEIMPAFWNAGRWRGESVGRKRDGTPFPQEISLSRIENGGLVCVVRDITERKLEEERRLAIDRKLQDAQRLESLGVMAGGIAHDFNNLLTAILGNASLGSMKVSEDSPVRQHLANIEKTSLQAADLCKQMLAYSGRGRFVIQRIDVNALITDMRHLLEISVSKSVVLKLELAQKLSAIEADPSQMRQVLMNLVINASEAIGANSGLVTVRTGTMHADHHFLSQTYLAPELPEGNYIFVEVSDTGCGMSPETQAKIFEPFFTTKFTGRGLGLAAVLGIIRGHKGAIKVSSEPGSGTTFKFLIPCADAPAEVLPQEKTPPSSWRGRGTILLVDDEPTVRTVTTQMLQSIGFQVISAADGREGVELFAQNCGDISAVVLDMTMPNMNGEETFRELRRLRGDINVILVSGYSEQDAMARFAGQGLSGFLQKPFKVDELRNKLQSVVENKPVGI